MKKQKYYDNKIAELSRWAETLCIDVLKELESFPNKTALSASIYKDPHSFHEIRSRVKRFLKNGEGEKALNACVTVLKKLNTLPNGSIEKLKSLPLPKNVKASKVAIASKKGKSTK